MNESAYHKFMQLYYVVDQIADKELARKIKNCIEELKNEINGQSAVGYSTASIYGQKYDTE